MMRAVTLADNPLMIFLGLFAALTFLPVGTYPPAGVAAPSPPVRVTQAEADSLPPIALPAANARARQRRPVDRQEEL